MRVTNGIPLGRSLLLPVCTVNCVAKLKGDDGYIEMDMGDLKAGKDGCCGINMQGTVLFSPWQPTLP
jgi:hypothetical protein